MSVFVTGAEFGVVRYIGHTEFSEGVWLGLELRRPSKSDIQWNHNNQDIIGTGESVLNSEISL